MSQDPCADPRAREVLADWADHFPRAILFDFNGTLSDDEPILLTIFTLLCDRHFGVALDPVDYYARLAGRSDREIVEVIVGEHATSHPAPVDGSLVNKMLVEELLIERREEYLRLVADDCPISSDTQALVRALAGSNVPLGIVTGAQRPDVAAVLASAGLAAHFATMITEEDVAVGKPDPEGYLSAARQLQIPPENILVFEDSLAGIAAAQSAGMRCLGIPGTRSAETLAALADGVAFRLTPDLFNA
ncbi:MAG: HAD family phosphatase [Actinomycetes bacterium]